MVMSVSFPGRVCSAYRLFCLKWDHVKELLGVFLLSKPSYLCKPVTFRTTQYAALLEEKIHPGQRSSRSACRPFCIQAVVSLISFRLPLWYTFINNKVRVCRQSVLLLCAVLVACQKVMAGPAMVKVSKLYSILLQTWEHLLTRDLVCRAAHRAQECQKCLRKKFNCSPSRGRVSGHKEKANHTKIVGHVLLL